MDLEYLRAYEQRERAEATAFADRLANGRVSPGEHFPRLDRFPRLRSPRTRAASAGDSIWPQLLTTGTLIVRLQPVAQAQCRRMNLFEPTDVPFLVEMAKKTGRVQFVLRADPTAYEGLEYLQPVFEELRPPMAILFPPALTSPESERARIEYEASFTLSRTYRKAVAHHGRATADAMLAGDQGTYAALRAMGLHDLADEIIDNVVVDTERASFLLWAARDLLLMPLSDYSGAIVGYDWSDFARGRSAVSGMAGALSNTGFFPHEIGSFLCGTLAHSPTDRAAFEHIAGTYEAQDVERLAAALQRHVEEERPDPAVDTARDLQEALRTAWEDGKRLARWERGLATGFRLAFGAVGLAAAGLPGLLGTLAAGAADRVLDDLHLAERTAMRFIRTAAPPHAVAVYDFRREHGV